MWLVPVEVREPQLGLVAAAAAGDGKHSGTLCTEQLHNCC